MAFARSTNSFSMAASVGQAFQPDTIYRREEVRLESLTYGALYVPSSTPTMAHLPPPARRSRLDLCLALCWP